LVCKNRCGPFIARVRPKVGRYASGQVRCPTCDCFLYPQGLTLSGKCNCCNSIVRTKPRLSKFSKKTRENLAIMRRQKIDLEKKEKIPLVINT